MRAAARPFRSAGVAEIAASLLSMLCRSSYLGVKRATVRKTCPRYSGAGAVNRTRDFCLEDSGIATMQRPQTGPQGAIRTHEMSVCRTDALPLGDPRGWW